MDRLRTSLALIALCFAVYAFSIGTPFYSSDSQVMYETSRANALEGQLNIPPADLPQTIEGRDSQFFSKYDPGLPLIAAPLVIYADHIAKTHAANRYAVAAVAVMLVPALAMALTISLLYDIARHLTTHWRALLVALTAAFATLAYPYARLFLAEAVIALCLTLAVWAILKRYGWLLAVAIAVGILTRATTLIYVPVLALWLYIHHEQPRRNLLLWLGLGAVIGVSGLLLHNDLRFGSLIETGYEGESFTGRGWLGLLISPGKSIFLHAPPLILSVILWPRFRREYRSMADLIAGLGLIALLVFGAWWAWHGGWVWGPRFLVPIVPLWCLPLTVLPLKRRWIGVLAILVLLGIGMQLLGAFTNVNVHYARVFGSAHPDSPARYHVVHWQDPPLFTGVEQAQAGEFEKPAFLKLKGTGLPVTWHTHFPLTVALIGILGGLSLVVSPRQALRRLRVQIPAARTDE